MVHPMHNAVSVRTQIIRALKNPGQHKKYLFRYRPHRKGGMGGIPMKEKRLKEKGKVPV